MNSSKNLVVYRAIIGNRLNSLQSDDRTGATVEEIRRDGLLCSNNSTGQSRRSPRDLSFSWMEKGVPGLPVFLDSQNPMLIARLNHYAANSIPAVVECGIPFALFAEERISLFKNSVEDNATDKRFNQSELMDIIRGKDYVSGEYFLVGANLKQTLVGCPITVWRPNKMNDGVVVESAGWYREGESFFEKLGFRGHRK